MKYRRYGIIFALTCLLTGCATMAGFRIQRQLDLGQQYLLELEFDKAMIAYSKVLQIKPKQMTAYHGISNVFTAQKDIDSSINVLKKGLTVADTLTTAERSAEVNREIRGLNSQIVTQLTDMGDTYYEKEKYDRALDYYKDLIVYDSEEENSYLKVAGTYEVMGDLENALAVLEDAELNSDTIRSERDRLAIRYEVKREYEELLARLAEMIKNGDGELAREMLLTEEFLELVSKLQEPLILQQGQDQYIVVYPNGYVYMGQMQDGGRSGYGDFYTNNTERYVIYSGAWENDKPNGSGQINTVVYTSLATMSPNYFGEGYFTDGISEGTFSFFIYYQNGRRVDYSFENYAGIPPTIRRQDNKNMVGYSVSDSSHYFLMSDSSVFSVPTFEPEGRKSVFTNTLTTR